MLSPLALTAAPVALPACPPPPLVDLLLVLAIYYFGSTLGLLSLEAGMLTVAGGPEKGPLWGEQVLRVASTYFLLAVAAVCAIYGIDEVVGWENLAPDLAPSLLIGLLLTPPIGTPLLYLVFFRRGIQSAEAFSMAAGTPLVYTAALLLGLFR